MSRVIIIKQLTNHRTIQFLFLLLLFSEKMSMFSWSVWMKKIRYMGSDANMRSGVTRYKIRITSSKLPRVDGKSWKLRRVFFGCVYPFFLQSSLQPLIFRFRIHARTSRPTTTMKRANQSLLTYLFHLFPFSSYLNVKQYLTLYLNFLRRNDILRSLEILGNKRKFGFIFKMNIGITELIQLTNKSIDSFFWYGSIDAWNLFIFFFSNIEKGKDLL